MIMNSGHPWMMPIYDNLTAKLGPVGWRRVGGLGQQVAAASPSPSQYVGQILANFTPGTYLSTPGGGGQPSCPPGQSWQAVGDWGAACAPVPAGQPGIPSTSTTTTTAQQSSGSGPVAAGLTLPGLASAQTSSLLPILLIAGVGLVLVIMLTGKH